MLNRARKLRGAGGVRAHGGGFLLCVVKDGLAARGTALGQIELALGAVAALGVGADDLWNNVARLAHGDNVAYHNSALAYELEIVQRRAADRRPREPDRLEHRGRSQHAGATDGNRNVGEARLLLLRRELVGHRPVGGVGALAEQLAPGERVELYDNAVNVVFKRVAQAANLANVVENVLRRAGDNPLADDGEAELGEPF